MSSTIKEPKCPVCGSLKVHKHDTYCDDEHEDESECWPFYCDACGEGFEVD